jgi:hypothetical protein
MKNAGSLKVETTLAHVVAYERIFGEKLERCASFHEEIKLF